MLLLIILLFVHLVGEKPLFHYVILLPNSCEAQPEIDDESDVDRINDTVSNDAEDMQNRCTEAVGDNEINNSGFEPSEGILQSESPDGGSQPVALRRSFCIRKAVDRYGAVPYVNFNLSLYLHI